MRIALRGFAFLFMVLGAFLIFASIRNGTPQLAAINTILFLINAGVFFINRTPS